MRGARPSIALLILTGLAACGGSEPGEPQSARADTEARNEIAAGASRTGGAPEVGDPYQERIDEAWRKAVQGENPAYACAALKGRALVGANGEAASRAVSACNVDIPVRYFQTYIERVEARERTCLDLVMEVTTKLPAMTISMDAFPEIAERGSGSHASDDAVVEAGAVLAGRGSSESIVKDRLRHRISEICPDEAGVLQGQSPPEPEALKPGSPVEALEVMAKIETMLAEAEAWDEAAEVARGDEPERRFDRGEPRGDLARFHGLYGIPGDVGPAARRLYVSESCGYLEVGATWGDVAPWFMRSVSETVFTESYPNPGAKPLEVKFRKASDGSAEALIHNGEFIESSLARVGELPEGWGGEPVEGCDHRVH